MENIYYVYAHKIKGTETIFYIGSNWRGGNPNRSYETIKRPKKWIDEVAKHNGDYDIEIVDYFEDGESAYKHELKLMAYYQDTFNWCWCNGERQGEEWRKKRSDSSFKRKIIVTKDDEETIYNSVRVASDKLNIKRPLIHYYLKTEKQNREGYSFRYCD